MCCELCEDIEHVLVLQTNEPSKQHNVVKRIVKLAPVS